MGSHKNEYDVQKSKIFTPAFYVFSVIVLISVFIIIYRYVMGIGYVSNLNDGWPWGIWIAYDVAVGTSIACGGYVLAITIYVMNNFKYHPMIRSAVLASMFGYCLAGLSVMVDIGRPWNSYNFFVPSQWQFNSALFEVALCIMAYSLVLIIEFLPAVYERTSTLTKYPRIAAFSKMGYKYIDKLLFLFLSVGVLLPTMHQSSLGTLMVATGFRLDDLWQTNFLPLLFLTNAVLMGFSVIVFETMLTTSLFKRSFEKEIISLSRIIPYVAVAFILIRFVSLTTSGAWGSVFTSGTLSVVFWLEIILLLIPSFIIYATQFGKSQRGLFVSAMTLMLGAGLYRFSVYLIGFEPGPGWGNYFPSINEFMITVGLISIEIVGYMVIVKLLQVLPNVSKSH